MRFKYYLNHTWFKLILLSFVIAIFMINIANAYTLESSGANPTKIFKCQPSIISANLTGYGSVTAVTLVLQNTGNIPFKYGIQQYDYKTYAMTYSGGYASYNFGNDPSLMEGTKSINFIVTEGGIPTTTGTGATIQVYSDTCIGTDAVSFRNITADTYKGGSNIQAFLASNSDPFSFVLGYIIYDSGFGSVIMLIIVLAIMVVIYINTKNIIHPLIVLVASISYFTNTTVVPNEYMMILLIIIALCLAGIMYKVYKKY